MFNSAVRAPVVTTLALPEASDAFPHSNANRLPHQDNEDKSYDTYFVA